MWLRRRGRAKPRGGDRPRGAGKHPPDGGRRAAEEGADISEAALIERARAGDTDACHDLVVAYQRPVYSVILRMVRDPAAAEDLVQETFVKAFRHLDSFDVSRKLSSWLFKIAHNTTLDALRRKTLPTVSLDPAEDESADHRKDWEDTRAASPDQRVERMDLAQAIEAAMGELPPRYREIIALRYQQGLAYQEIAEILELPMGTVKTHIHRARHALADTLRARGIQP